MKFEVVFTFKWGTTLSTNVLIHFEYIDRFTEDKSILYFLEKRPDITKNSYAFGQAVTGFSPR